MAFWLPSFALYHHQSRWHSRPRVVMKCVRCKRETQRSKTHENQQSKLAWMWKSLPYWRLSEQINHDARSLIYAYISICIRFTKWLHTEVDQCNHEGGKTTMTTRMLALPLFIPWHWLFVAILCSSLGIPPSGYRNLKNWLKGLTTRLCNDLRFV